MTTTNNDAILSLTSEAVEAVTDVISDMELEDPSVAALRVYVAGGGCSGLAYGMSIDGSTNDDDISFVVDGDIRVIVDPLSARYLKGAVLNYVQVGSIGKGFKVENPNATKSCGCGASFTTEDAGDTKLNGGGGCAGCGPSEYKPGQKIVPDAADRAEED